MKIKDTMGRGTWQCQLCSHPPFAALFALTEHTRKVRPKSQGGLAR